MRREGLRHRGTLVADIGDGDDLPELRARDRTYPEYPLRWHPAGGDERAIRGKFEAQAEGIEATELGCQEMSGERVA